MADELRDLIAERGGFLDELSEMQTTLQERESEYNDHNQELTEIRLREANRSQELTQANGQIIYYAHKTIEKSDFYGDKYNALYILTHSDTTLTKQEILTMTSERADISMQDFTPDREKLAIAMDLLERSEEHTSELQSR